MTKRRMRSIKVEIRKAEEQMKQVEQQLQKQIEQQIQDSTLVVLLDGYYRLFCGNLGNEASDEVLANSFRKYPSFARLQIIRDTHTMKTRGHGFISFLNANGYLKAFKEMNGKYVGNRHEQKYLAAMIFIENEI